MGRWYAPSQIVKIQILSLRAIPEMSMAAFGADSAENTKGKDAPGGLQGWISERHDLIRYALAPLAIVIALIVRVLLAPVLREDSPYLLFVPAVLVAAGLGGL